ncbi:hypothetical protein OG562_39635 [Streptomyces sp. NBC_01275]|uniref:hypothetical protein n=1 Tax=Streptomyces sp. NBC_01275 TaxID=2903807 RepID=UPI00224FEB50|nr:hypothetical protein [Streptomyces sp. NBC_01275]MCX4766976.1 hypothetical protein [Streptomyces sp. NBC_01275]
MNDRRIPLKKRFRLAAAVAATSAVLVSAPYASAATDQTQPKPVVTHVKTVASFDFAVGDAPENVTLNPDGSLTVSMLGGSVGRRPALVRVDVSGHREVLVAGQPGDMITGNARGHDGSVYYNVSSADAARSGVWKLPLDGSPRRIAALPAGELPNGLAIDPAGRTLYVAESFKGVVWSVPVSGGTATRWLTDASLAPAESPLPLGANGLRFHNGAVWVSNFSKGALLRVPVTATGSAGPVHVVTSGVVGIDDFNFLSGRSDVVFAALNSTDEIAVVYPNGAKKTVLTAADGLASPTATVVRGQRLYITDGGFAESRDAKLQQGKINFSALFASSAS